MNGFFWSIQNFIKETNYIPIFHLGNEEHFNLEMRSKEIDEVFLKLGVGFVYFLKNILKYVTLHVFQADYIICVVVAL